LKNRKDIDARALRLMVVSTVSEAITSEPTTIPLDKEQGGSNERWVVVLWTGLIMVTVATVVVVGVVVVQCCRCNLLVLLLVLLLRND
jgi:hypothetical protein